MGSNKYILAESIGYKITKTAKLITIRLVDRGAIVGGESSGQQTVENEVVKTTQAYENGNIVYLDPVYWYITSGGITSTAGMIVEVEAALSK